MIVVVIVCIIDKSNKIGIGAFSKYGIVLISGILYKIIKINFPKTENK